VVLYDPDAVAELATAVKAKEDRAAIFNVVDKLRHLGEDLVPPHMKPLKGPAAASLRELRPRQGRSDWRLIFTRRPTSTSFSPSTATRTSRRLLAGLRTGWRGTPT